MTNKKQTGNKPPHDPFHLRGDFVRGRGVISLCGVDIHSPQRKVPGGNWVHSYTVSDCPDCLAVKIRRLRKDQRLLLGRIQLRHSYAVFVSSKEAGDK